MNRKFKKQRILAFILMIIFILAFPAVAFATDINVTADSTSVKVGDTVTLTVTVSAQHISVADGVFTYDPALLSYIGSNGGASDGYINMVSAQKGGASSLTTVIKFAAIGEGEAEIYVSIDSVLDYDEQPLEKAEAGVSITVASSGTAETGETGETPTSPPIDLSLTGVAAENVLGTSAQMYIWRSLNNLTLPSGFVDRQVTYGEEYVGGAAIPDNEDLILLYLSEASGENAGYYIYDEEKNILFPYLTVLSVSANYTLIWPDDSIEIPEGYEETTFEWKESEVPAWAAQGSDGCVYLVYARNSSGETGLYLYNTEDKSVQSYIASPETESESAATPTAESSEEPVSAQFDDEETDSIIKMDFTLFIILCAAFVLLIVIVVVLAVLYAAKNSRSKTSEQNKTGNPQDKTNESNNIENSRDKTNRSNNIENSRDQTNRSNNIENSRDKTNESNKELNNESNKQDDRITVASWKKDNKS